MNDCVDCRSEVGITVGLIDAIISCARVIARRDLTAPAVVKALKDIRSDEDVRMILTPILAVESDTAP